MVCCVQGKNIILEGIVKQSCSDDVACIQIRESLKEVAQDYVLFPKSNLRDSSPYADTNHTLAMCYVFFNSIQLAATLDNLFVAKVHLIEM